MLKRMFEYDTIHKGNGKKYDLILISVILFTAFILWGILQFVMQPGDMLSVSYDGEVLGQIPLEGFEDRYYLVRCGDTELIELTDSQVKDYVLREESVQRPKSLPQQESVQDPMTTDFSMDGDYNMFVCRKDGTVRMLAASCPDQICVNHKEIKASMNNIICLPHRLVLEIVSDGESKTEELDGIAY